MSAAAAAADCFREPLLLCAEDLCQHLHVSAALRMVGRI